MGFEEKVCSCDFWCVDFWVVTGNIDRIPQEAPVMVQLGIGIAPLNKFEFDRMNPKSKRD